VSNDTPDRAVRRALRSIVRGSFSFSCAASASSPRETPIAVEIRATAWQPSVRFAGERSEHAPHELDSAVDVWRKAVPRTGRSAPLASARSSRRQMPCRS